MTQTGSGPTPKSEFRRIPEAGGAEVLSAQFERFTFRKHAHDRLAIGIVPEGGMKTVMSRGSFVASPGSVITFNPDIVHWGGAATSDPWIQQTLLIDEDAFSDLLEDIRGHRRDDKFSAPVVEHRGLFDAYQKLHRLLRLEADPVRRECALLDFLNVLSQSTGLVPEMPTAGQEPAAIRCARDYIDAHFAETIRLSDLASHCGLSRFRLVRAFRSSVGMPPHAYQLHRRIREAEQRLRRGDLPADVAVDCGFSDQAHLTRTFRQANALTPAQFRRG